MLIRHTKTDSGETQAAFVESFIETIFFLNNFTGNIRQFDRSHTIHFKNNMRIRFIYSVMRTHSIKTLEL